MKNNDSRLEIALPGDREIAITLTIRREDQASRDMAPGSNMQSGFEASNGRLDELIG